MIIPVRNPATYDLPEVQDLIHRAFSGVAPTTAENALAEFRAHVANPHMTVFIGRDDAVFRALAVLMIPTSNLMPEALVYHFYNEGSTTLRDALVDAVVDTARQNGYYALQTANLNAHDKAFVRLFKRAGPATKVGSLFRFDIGEVDSWAGSETHSLEAQAPQPK